MSLARFIWSNPLRNLYEEKKRSKHPDFYNIYLDYEDHLVFLTIIWDRLKEDYTNFNEYSDFHEKLSNKARNLSEGSFPYRLSREEVQELSNLRNWEMKLFLDYESFIVFSNILMDKVGKLATYIIDTGPKLIRTKRFTDHKKLFLQSDNIPFAPNEKYAKLIREQTEWYDLSLAAIRDKVIVHGNARMRSIPYYARQLRGNKPYSRPIKMVRVSSFIQQNDKIIEIKRKYESKYPDLKNIYNVWEVLTYILDNNVKLSIQDKSEVTNIISSTGARLPDLVVLATNISKFLQDVYEALR
jgi:hypothetical protein